MSGPAGRVFGPFTVTTDQTDRDRERHRREYVLELVRATCRSPMERMCRRGQKIWVRSTGPPLAVLQATAKATVPTGNVYLWDGNNPGSSAPRS